MRHPLVATVLLARASGASARRAALASRLLLLLATTVSGLGAQDGPVAGDRLRITDRVHGTVLAVGVLLDRAGDTVQLSVRGTPRRVALDPGRHALEVSAGRHRHVLLGAFVGAAAGALAGYGVVRSTEDPDAWMKPLGRTAGAGIGAGVGAVVGGLIGAVPHDRWRPVGLPLARGRPSVSIGPWGAVVRVGL